MGEYLDVKPKRQYTLEKKALGAHTAFPAKKPT
jgi:hypothetical protein